jgi:S-formylglutathione hydrolase FrmB
VKLRINQTLPPLHLLDTDDLKYVRLRSDVLSTFYGRYVHLYAAVALPPAYPRDKVRRFPTLYLVPGFGGTIRDEGYVRMMRGLLDQAGFDAVVVYLDADCPTGHHVFADSANNGPWGTALVTELIPYLEQRFRLIVGTDARYVSGASSGGWSSLWLQITYPETFGGVWSMSPDPVDFSAFQTINIYDPNENFLTDAGGRPRPVTRPMTFGKTLILRDFCRMEEVLGRGGQFQSFDAVFSPRGSDGQPLPLWDRRTGRVDPQVAEAWKKYDIRLILEAGWKSLGPRLRGKLHLYCGDEDDFFLERAFAKLCDTLKRLGSDAYMEVVPGGGHALPPSVWLRAIEQMKQQYEAHYGARVVFSRLRGTTLQARLALRRLPATGGVGSVRVGDGEDAGDDAVEDGLDTRLHRVDGGRAELVGDRVVA